MSTDLFLHQSVYVSRSGQENRNYSKHFNRGNLIERIGQTDIGGWEEQKGNF